MLPKASLSTAIQVGVCTGVIAIMAACTVPAFASGGGGGPTFTVKFKGAPINGVVPECEVKVDESQALSGGDTIVTTQIKNVNLPNGTVLKICIDNDPLDTIEVEAGQGTEVTDIGRFAPGGRDSFQLLDENFDLIAGGQL
jgi:hypothetical protein